MDLLVDYHGKTNMGNMGNKNKSIINQLLVTTRTRTTARRQIRASVVCTGGTNGNMIEKGTLTMVEPTSKQPWTIGDYNGGSEDL